MLTTSAANAFLAQDRISVVGASDENENFGGALYRALKAHGHQVVAVNPTATTVDGDACYPTLGSVPGSLGGVLIVLRADRAAGVVRECIDRQVQHIWLFKGLGGPGAASEETIRLCREAGVNVVEGACPLMFLEPVGLGHRVHRGLRRLNRSLVTTG
ncbi:MAG TPA: CoA-binding protein [Nitriliruptorales bacterium]|jgi:hypothetical protein